MRLLGALSFLLTVYAVSDNTILLQRACRKRPALDFCKGVTVSNVTEVTVQTGNALKKVELVLPPPIPTEEKHPKPSVQERNEDKVDFEADNREFENKTEKIGSLLSLPKPVNNSVLEKKEEQAKVGALLTLPKPVLTATEATTKGTVNIAAPEPEPKVETPIPSKFEVELPPPPPIVVPSSTPASRENLESDKQVLVFVSEFCVVERERFVKKCYGEVDPKEVNFCKSYPPACTGTSNVIPVLTYCQRYFTEYPKLCANNAIHEMALQFCFAFEQFCLPELAAAAAAPKEYGDHPKSNLRRCEDVLPEARTACNPFPHPKDTFNVLRCTQFLTHCKKFVDW